MQVIFKPVIGLLAAVCAVAIVRNAFVLSYAESAPQRAARLWPTHPDVLISGALTDIGLAAVQRQGPPQNALRQLQLAQRLAPLAQDPFLARGIQAQQEGQADLAEQAFLAARWRAPRDSAPRYFLAQQYLASNRGELGLGEMATLARLLPAGPSSVAPSLAAYARTVSDLRGLRAAFRRNPILEQAVLVELSKDPANAGLSLRLATKLREADGSAPDWVKNLLPRLVESGQTRTAYRIWQATSGISRTEPLFDAGFKGSKAPPPFNWTLLSDARGFAEPDGNGGLHVLYYGRDNADLASQTLMLTPGQYRLSMRVAGNPGGMLKWSISCLPAGTEAGAVDLGNAGSGVRSAVVTIGANCPTQRLDLKGVALDLAKQVDLTISELSLRRDANGQ